MFIDTNYFADRFKEPTSMRSYIGTKQINAKPMNRADYNALRGWTLPGDENGADEGYLVEYTDGGKPNMEGFEGYVSWSPKAQFEKAYWLSTDLTFGLALEALKQGKTVTRKGWNGKGQYLFLVKAISFANIAPNLFTDALAIKTAHDVVQIGWLASQTDMLSDDWVILHD